MTLNPSATGVQVGNDPDNRDFASGSEVPNRSEPRGVNFRLSPSAEGIQEAYYMGKVSICCLVFLQCARCPPSACKAFLLQLLVGSHKRETRHERQLCGSRQHLGQCSLGSLACSGVMVAYLPRAFRAHNVCSTRLFRCITQRAIQSQAYFRSYRHLVPHIFQMKKQFRPIIIWFLVPFRARRESRPIIIWFLILFRKKRQFRIMIWFPS